MLELKRKKGIRKKLTFLKDFIKFVCCLLLQSTWGLSQSLTPHAIIGRSCWGHLFAPWQMEGRWEEARHTLQMPWLISDLITAPLGMFFLFTEHQHDGWLPGRPRLLSRAKLSDFPRVFFSSWLVVHNQFPGLSLSARNTETHHIFNLSTLVVCKKNNHRLEMFCLSGPRQKRRGPETCYVSLLHLPLTHPRTIHANAPNKIYSKPWC